MDTKVMDAIASHIEESIKKASDSVRVEMPMSTYKKLEEQSQVVGELYKKYKIAMEILRIRDEGRDETEFLSSRGIKLELKNNEYHLTIKTK